MADSSGYAYRNGAEGGRKPKLVIDFLHARSDHAVIDILRKEVDEADIVVIKQFGIRDAAGKDRIFSKHRNFDEENATGGFVEATSYASSGSFIHHTAIVKDNAQVMSSYVADGTIVDGMSIIEDSAVSTTGSIEA